MDSVINNRSLSVCFYGSGLAKQSARLFFSQIYNKRPTFAMLKYSLLCQNNGTKRSLTEENAVFCLYMYMCGIIFQSFKYSLWLPRQYLWQARPSWNTCVKKIGSFCTQVTIMRPVNMKLYTLYQSSESQNDWKWFLSQYF